MTLRGALEPAEWAQRHGPWGFARRAPTQRARRRFVGCGQIPFKKMAAPEEASPAIFSCVWVFFTTRGLRSSVLTAPPQKGKTGKSGPEKRQTSRLRNSRSAFLYASKGF
jgi:hypothetical protein